MAKAGGMRLGIEIGGTKLQLGLGLGDGVIVARERRVIVPKDGAAGVLAQILVMYESLLRSSGTPRDGVRAAGVGFGGPVDASAGRATTSHTVPGWDDFPVVDWVKERLHVPTAAVENDADAAGLAEARHGAGVGRSPVLYLTVGSGIGGGLVVDGGIYRGAGAGAVEVGHLWVTGRDSEPGLVELETVASGWGIAASARRYAERHAGWPVAEEAGGAPSVTTEHVADAARRGDPAALGLLGRAVEALSEGLRQAVTLLAPARVILGGGVSLIGEDLWLGPIRRRLDATVFPPFRGTFDLVPAALGEDVVIHGALALASDLRRDDPS